MQTNWSPPLPKLLGSIQSLRAIAIFMVALGHASATEYFFASGYDISPGMALQNLPAGNAAGTVFRSVNFLQSGVDLFFVISGFVMVHVGSASARGPRAALKFFASRALRIYPIYWLALGFTVFLSSSGLLYSYLERQHLLTPHDILLAPSPYYQAVPVSWSLVHEIYFYLVFSCILLLERSRLPGALFVWAALIMFGNLTGIAQSHHVLRIVFHYATLEFICGAYVALLITSRPTFKPSAIAWAGLASTLLMFITWTVIGPSFKQSGFLYYAWSSIGYGALLYGVVGSEFQTGRVLARPLVRIGDLSYSLYLFHFQLMMLVGLAAQRVAERVLPQPVRSQSVIDNYALLVLALSTSLAISALIAISCELPSRRLAKKILKSVFRAA